MNQCTGSERDLAVNRILHVLNKSAIHLETVIEDGDRPKLKQTFSTVNLMYYIRILNAYVHTTNSKIINKEGGLLVINVCN